MAKKPKRKLTPSMMAKRERCVMDLKGRYGKSRAFAICTAAQTKAAAARKRKRSR